MTNPEQIREIAAIRSGKPAGYPDHAVHAGFAAGRLGLAFHDLDGDSGLVFQISHGDRRITFGGGRCSHFPQNNAAASTLAMDKYFANVVLEHAGIPTLGGQYFFLHARHRAYRAAGHERSDAAIYLETLGERGFIKPLAGSRGDFAQAIAKDALSLYLDEVARYYDAALIQPIVTGDEYRIFVLDNAVLYCARKHPATLTGDGTHSLGALAAAHNAKLASLGISPAIVAATDPVPAAGERVPLAGRMNLSAGGAMRFETPASEAVFEVARRAARALGLRAAGVDVLTNVNGDPDSIAVIEVNANPSIRFLEDGGRPDLILKIWQHTFAAMGLISV